MTLSACAASGPENPTYDDDVRPLLVARCLRCHGNPGAVDPLSAKTGPAILKAPATRLDYPYLADIPSDAMTKFTSLAKYTRGPVMAYPRMPPAPAAVLEEWESQMLETWGKNPK